MPLFSVLFSLAFFFWMVFVPVESSTYYVSPEGIYSYNCSQPDFSYSQIQFLISNCCRSGDTIVLRNGTFSANALNSSGISITNLSLNIKADSVLDSILDCEGITNTYALDV